MKKILVYAEQEGGKLHPITFELLGKARQMADATDGEVSCALLGSGVSEAAQELVAGGCDIVYVYDDASLSFFDALNYRQNLVALMGEIEPDIVLFGSTLMGKSLAPRVAAALEAGLTSNCVALELDADGTLKQTRPAFTGTFLATIVTTSVPTMATVRPVSLRAWTVSAFWWGSSWA